MTDAATEMDKGDRYRGCLQGSFRTRPPPEIQGSGYVVRSLEAALWASNSSHSFWEGTLKAVNPGRDADTTGAIYGQLAGAFYGESGIPHAWLQNLKTRSLIIFFAQELLAIARWCDCAEEAGLNPARRDAIGRALHRKPLI